MPPSTVIIDLPKEAAGAAIVGLRDANVIGQEAMRRLQRDFDLDEIRDASWTREA